MLYLQVYAESLSTASHANKKDVVMPSDINTEMRELAAVSTKADLALIAYPTDIGLCK